MFQAEKTRAQNGASIVGPTMQQRDRVCEWCRQTYTALRSGPGRPLTSSCGDSCTHTAQNSLAAQRMRVEMMRFRQAPARSAGRWGAPWAASPAGASDPQPCAPRWVCLCIAPFRGPGLLLRTQPAPFTSSDHWFARKASVVALACSGNSTHSSCVASGSRTRTTLAAVARARR